VEIGHTLVWLPGGEVTATGGLGCQEVWLSFSKVSLGLMPHSTRAPPSIFPCYHCNSAVTSMKPQVLLQIMITAPVLQLSAPPPHHSE